MIVIRTDRALASTPTAIATVVTSPLPFATVPLDREFRELRDGSRQSEWPGGEAAVDVLIASRNLAAHRSTTDTAVVLLGPRAWTLLSVPQPSIAQPSSATALLRSATQVEVNSTRTGRLRLEAGAQRRSSGADFRTAILHWNPIEGIIHKHGVLWPPRLSAANSRAIDRMGVGARPPTSPNRGWHPCH